MTGVKKFVVPGIIVALLVAAAVVMFQGEERKTLTAHFPRTVSIYEGSDVRVLGVPVGTVDTVTPSGTDVVVTMSYDAEHQGPRRRPGRHHRPVDRRRPVRAAHPRLRGGRGAGRRRHADRGADGRPARAGPDLLQHGPADGGARPDRRQPQRCAVRPARDHREELRRPGRAVPPDHRGLQQVQPDPGQQQGGAVRLRRGAGGLHRHPRRERPDRPAVQPVAGRRLHDAGRGARRAEGVAEEPRRRRWARSPRSSRRTATPSAATSRA